MRWWSLKQLKSKDAATRLKAVKKLAEGEPSEGIKPLLEIIDDPDPGVAAAAIKTLGAFKADEAVAPLLAALHARSSDVREAAAEGLKLIGDARAIDPLVEALRDENNGVRWRAANALESLGWRPEDDTQEVLQLVALGKLEKASAYGSVAVDPLVLVLKGGVYYKRMQAVEALSKIADPRVVKPLVGALRDDDNHVRAATVEALARVGDARAVEPLVATLRDQDNRVRANSVEALSKIGDARAIEPLAKLLTDQNWDVRIAVVEALGKFKDPRVTPQLTLCLKDKDRDIRQTTVMSLGKIGGTSAVEALVIALTDEHEGVRQSAAAMLKRIDPNWIHSEGAKRAIPKLQQSLKANEYWVRQAAHDVLAKIGADQGPAATEQDLSTFADPVQIKRQLAFDALLHALGDGDRDLRQAAAEALGRVGDQRALPTLVKTIDDGDSWVRKAAAESLEALHWQPVEEKQRAQQMVILERWNEVTALGRAAVEPLVEALRHKSSYTRVNAARALSKIGDGKAIEPLAALLADKLAMVRRAAADALEALNWQPWDETLQAKQLVELRRWDDVVQHGPAAVHALIAAIKEKHDDPELASAAEAALARITDPRAVGPLVAYANDPDVARAMATGLEQILAFQADGVEEADLRTIAGFTQLMEAKMEYDDVTGMYFPLLEEIDCSLVVQLAQQELARRAAAT